MTKLKAGDKIVFGRGKANKELAPDVLIGRIYTLFEGNMGLGFIDEVGDTNYAGIGSSGRCKATKIIEGDLNGI